MNCINTVSYTHLFSTGLKRNIVQCLDDYDIPLNLSHTVTKIKGERSLSSVEISQVDNNLKPVKGTERNIKCDTLLPVSYTHLDVYKRQPINTQVNPTFSISGSSVSSS